MTRTGISTTLVALTLLGLAGCRCSRCERRPLNDRLPSANDRNGRYLGEPIAPPSGNFIPPPAGGLPAPSFDGPPVGSSAPPPAGSVPDSPFNRSFRTTPGKPTPEVLMPQQGVGPELFVPEQASKGLLGEPVRAAETTSKSGTISSQGLPGFARAKEGIATGRTPTADGWDALKAGGYRTALCLHEPNSDVTTVREQATKHGLAFVAIPVAADRYSDAVKQFADAIADKPSRPVYVFDDNGVRTGSLWYTYYRTSEFLSDDEAKVKAARLGLSDSPSSEQTTFWIAVQKYLSTR